MSSTRRGFKVINLSSSPVTLLTESKGKYQPCLVRPKDYLIVERLTEQIQRLADPALGTLKIQII